MAFNRLRKRFGPIAQAYHQAFDEEKLRPCDPTFQAQTTMRDLIHWLMASDNEDIAQIRYHHRTAAVYVRLKTVGPWSLVIYARVED